MIYGTPGEENILVPIENEEELLPKEFSLSQNYPNPFNPNTSIKFSIPKVGKVRLEVFNVGGSLIKSIIDSEVMQAGEYDVKWNGTDNAGQRVASGIYFARLTTQNYMQSIKMNLIK